jgi:hypothetical protein
VCAEDVALAARDLAARRAVSLWVRPNPVHASLWSGSFPGAVRTQKISHIVDLEGGPEAVRSRFGASAVKGIKTAEKRHVRVETGLGGALLPEFFQLATKSRALWARRQHEPVWLGQLRGRLRDSEAKWNRIARHLGQDFQVTVAWHEERPVAAGIVLQQGNAHGTRAAMAPEARLLGASHLINWVVLQNACAAGARRFHMGESATPGAAAFKESFGARAHAFEEFCLERVPFSRGEAIVRAAVKALIGFRGGGPSTGTDRREGTS